MQIPDDLHVKTLSLGLVKPISWGLATGVLAAVLSLFMPNYYRSEAKLLPVDTKSLGGNLGGLASAAAAIGVSVPGGDGSDANYVDVLNSRWLRERLLVTEFTYHLPRGYFGTPKEIKGTLYDYLDQKNMDRAIKAMTELFGASRDLKTKVISISADTKSPELSQQAVKRAIQLLEQFNQGKGRTRGGAKAAFAEARLRESRQELEEVEEAFRRFLEGNRNYLSSADPGVRLKGTRLENELKLRQQLVTTLALNREQALLEEKNDIPILNVMDPGNLPIDKSRPARSLIVFAVTILTAVTIWGWEHRDWIQKHLLNNGEPNHPGVA